jgi:hypothetical protein
MRRKFHGCGGFLANSDAASVQMVKKEGRKEGKEGGQGKMKAGRLEDVEDCEMKATLRKRFLPSAAASYPLPPPLL